MSKRFGRRRKANMLKEISNLKEQIGYEQDVVERAKQIISIVYRKAPNSTCFRAAKRSLSSLLTYSSFVSHHPNDIVHNRQYNPDDIIDINYIDLYELKLQISKCFRNDVHFNARFQSISEKVDSGYVISREGLENIDIDYLSREIAAEFKQHFSKLQIEEGYL